MSAGRFNHLASEKSPYLIQHAANPVDWHAWGEEATTKARNDGKPILLSIGYSTCHWCHQMRRESFENRKTAEFINRNFVPVKVDREERPDVDSYYMNAVQGMTGQGGWPLTVFLTPDLKPFYGGTYFPPEPRYRMPSFIQVLEFVVKLWKDSRGKVTTEAERIAKALQETQEATGGGTLSSAIFDEAFAALAASFDPEHGGFGVAPKFPLPQSLEFMLAHHYRSGKELALKTVTKTLEAMASGGIHDHVGGGFHRYSTDRSWLVPHFEKMLYDNALLARVYIDAYQACGNPEFAGVAKDTLGWMLAELESPDGGFYSAQDADTEEGEGVYYTWTPSEVKAVLTQREAEIFNYVYGVTSNGNFEGRRTILHVANSPENAASKFETTTARLQESLTRARATLYRARLERPRPATDTKVLTSWNGLAISALAAASGAFAEPSYRDAALRAARFVLERNVKGGELMRRYAGGEAGIPAVLEDYALLGLGLVDLFEATSEPRWLEETTTLAERMVTLFEDHGGGGFFSGAGGVPTRMVETYDGPLPSGNSAAVVLLLRLSTIAGLDKFRSSAEKALRRLSAGLGREPTSHTFMLAAADAALNGTRQVVVSAKTIEAAQPFLGKLRERFLPNTVSFAVTDENRQRLSELTPLVEGRLPRSEPLAYVCQNFSCRLPASTPEELERQLAPIWG